MINEQIYVLGDLTYPGSPLAPKAPKASGQAPGGEAAPARKVRPAAVAGRFYPDDPAQLAAMIDGFLTDAATWMGDELAPTGDQAGALKAMISPHAGYVFSGPVAATGYVWLQRIAQQIKRVVLIGPAHYVGFQGIATVSADAMATPLGQVTVDRELVDKALELPFVNVNDKAHEAEHGLEVHLPLLQHVLGAGSETEGKTGSERDSDFTVAPFIFSRTNGERCGELLEKLWGGPETLILVSSDLSHFYNYDDANALDRAACEAIERFEPAAIKEEQACGRLAIQGLLHVGPSHNLHVKTLDLRNSGDTAGSKDRVVGYGSWVFWEGEEVE